MRQLRFRLGDGSSSRGGRIFRLEIGILMGRWVGLAVARHFGDLDLGRGRRDLVVGGMLKVCHPKLQWVDLMEILFVALQLLMATACRGSL